MLFPAPDVEVYTPVGQSALVDQVIYSEDHVTDPTTCAGYCSLNSQCMSFNYNSQLNTCEISNTTRHESEAPARDGFLYYEPLKVQAFSHDDLLTNING